MGLPDRIEIEPLAGPVRAEVAVPGSKSLTNRALILAALARGTTTLRGALWSEDTQVMVIALRQLGFSVVIAPDPDEPANCRLTVQGLGGEIPRGGTAAAPLELWVGNAGTAARFLAALVCLGRGWYRLSGVSRMLERPQAALLHALEALGYTVQSANGRLPAVIEGKGPRPGACTVSIAESSQFASALLLCAPTGGWTVNIEGENAEESPYVAMTSEMRAAFPSSGGTFQIEPDASSGSYFWGAGFLLAPDPGSPPCVTVAHWPVSGWQVDAAFPQFWPLPAVVSRQHDLGDSILTAMVLAPTAKHPIQFTDLGRLRLQECDRVAALHAELAKCGARIVERGDTLEILPSTLHGAEIATYQDHRIAMAFAILGLKIPGIILQDPGCVKKTFLNFFQKLALPPPAGLGVRLRDPQTGQRLELADLAAD